MAKPWKCGACGKKFKTRFAGSIHINKAHPPPDLIYTMGPWELPKPPESLSSWGGHAVQLDQGAVVAPSPAYPQSGGHGRTISAKRYP